MSVKGRKAEQYEHTRRVLLDVARRLFADHGYTGTGTEEVVRQAGVTRGALYYHFRDKRDLFRAVVEDLQQEILGKVQAAAAATADPWEGLRAGLHAFLDACMEPAVQRIVLVDAPSVLGWAAWRELDAKYGFGLLRTVLQGLMDAGLLEPQPVEPLAHMLLGALSEAGMVIAQAGDVEAARRDVGASLDRLLRGLRSRP
jgi:AcrR family transcriptional regulator